MLYISDVTMFIILVHKEAGIWSTRFLVSTLIDNIFLVTIMYYLTHIDSILTINKYYTFKYNLIIS